MKKIAAKGRKTLAEKRKAPAPVFDTLVDDLLEDKEDKHVTSNGAASTYDASHDKILTSINDLVHSIAEAQFQRGLDNDERNALTNLASFIDRIA